MARRLNEEASPYNIANLLTFGRLLAVPLFIWLMVDGDRGWALVVFGLAAITDWLDGFLARRFNLRTALGVFIDPLADKLLILSAFVVCTRQGQVPLWLTLMAFARELLVAGGYTLLAVVARMTEVRSSFWGKAGTLAQFFALAGVLAGWTLGAPETWSRVLLGALGLAVLFNFVTGLDYALKGAHAYEGQRRGRQS